MKLYESSEDYLEQILVLTNKKGQIRSIDIVESMNFSKPSVSIAMKKLRENGYIDIDSKGYIKLTPLGQEVANKTYERHIVLSSFFERIGVSEENALKDACRVEHDLSDETFDALKKHVKTLK